MFCALYFITKIHLRSNLYSTGDIHSSPALNSWTISEQTGRDWTPICVEHLSLTYQTHPSTGYVPYVCHSAAAREYKLPLSARPSQFVQLTRTHIKPIASKQQQSLGCTMYSQAKSLARSSKEPEQNTKIDCSLKERSHAIKLKTSPARLAQLLHPSLAFCWPTVRASLVSNVVWRRRLSVRLWRFVLWRNGTS